MTYDEFVALASRPHKGWRAGQTAFNLLHGVRPDLSAQVRGVYQLDPFYRDEFLPAFYAFLQERW